MSWEKTNPSSTGGGTSEDTKLLRGFGIGLGATVGGVGLYFLIRHIVKIHKKTKERKAKERNSLNNISYGSRDLFRRDYGSDVDRMIDLLIENHVLGKHEKTYSPKKKHHKYNRKVKRSVKRMQARMGMQQTGNASVSFQRNLGQWKKKKVELRDLIFADSLNITESHDACLAVAILLVEKGYLQNYDVSNILNKEENSRIVAAYHVFQSEHQLPKSVWIDERILRLLYSLPNRQ